MLFAEAPTHDLSIFDPVSPPAESIRSLSVLVLAITGGIFVVVVLLFRQGIWGTAAAALRRLAGRGPRRDTT